MKISKTSLWLSVLVALLVLLASASGIFLKSIYARETPSWALQGIGQDIVNLVAVVVLFIAAYFVSKGSVKAFLVWGGVLLYLLYSYIIYAFDVHFNSLFLVYVAIVGLSFYALVGSVIHMHLDSLQASFSATTKARLVSVFLLVLGDEVVKHPTFNATRTVTIKARPEEIWPWLLQMGVTRAGWYSYEWLDNLGKPSAKHIIPELQQVAIGDMMPMSPDGKQGLRVKDFEVNQWMLWWDNQGDSTWYWGLYPQDENLTRLVTRVRVHYHWLSPIVFFNLLVEFTDIIMMRKCMMGIKRRAEYASRVTSELIEATGSSPTI